MPVTLTIKRVPDRVAERLRARAAQSHRSLQGELMAILASALYEAPLIAAERESPDYRVVTQKAGRATAKRTSKERALTLADVWEMGRRAGLSSPPESVEVIRKSRNERYGR